MRSTIFIGKSEGRRPLGRPEHKLLDNIKMDLKYQDGIQRPELLI
jgi:hypothetical protein